jgi:hypothetical protein
MTIRLSDNLHVPDLLAFLRERGCIAYAVGDPPVVEVVEPERERDVRRLLEIWLADRAALGVELVD